MTKIAGSGSKSGSGSIGQRHGSADPDPDPPQNVMDPQHWWRASSGVNTLYLTRFGTYKIALPPQQKHRRGGGRKDDLYGLVSVVIWSMIKTN
jgi:hypothetical protein